MHYSPRIWPESESDPELRLIFLSLPPSATPRAPAAAGLPAAHDTVRPSRRGPGPGRLLVLAVFDNSNPDLLLQLSAAHRCNDDRAWCLLGLW
jgi:hypothetical protein